VTGAEEIGPQFGVIIATRPRCRFLPKAIDQVRRQTCPHWRCVVACDGPAGRARQMFDRHSGGDPRFSLIEQPLPANDWGYTPRGNGLKFLLNLDKPPDYVLFWDDDNEFHPDALEVVRRAVRHHAAAEMVLVPVKTQLSQIPQTPFDALRANLRNMDNANFVMKLSALRQCYWGDDGRGQRGSDPRLFQRMRAAGHRIVLADVPPIGRYDGLRPLMSLRWRLGIPRLGFAKWKWCAPLRRLLRA